MQYRKNRALNAASIELTAEEQLALTDEESEQYIAKRKEVALQDASVDLDDSEIADLSDEEKAQYFGKRKEIALENGSIELREDEIAELSEEEQNQYAKERTRHNKAEKKRKKLQDRIGRRRAKFAGFEYNAIDGTYTDKDGNQVSEEELNKQLNEKGISVNEETGDVTHAGEKMGFFKRNFRGAAYVDRKNKRARNRAEFGGYDYNALTGKYEKKDENGNVTERLDEDKMNNMMNAYGVKQGIFGGVHRKNVFTSSKKVDLDKAGVTYDAEKGMFVGKDGENYGSTIQEASSNYRKNFVAEQFGLKYDVENKKLRKGEAFVEMQKAHLLGLKYEKGENGAPGKFLDKDGNEVTNVEERMEQQGITLDKKTGTFSRHGQELTALDKIAGFRRIDRKNGIAIQKALFTDFDYDAATGKYYEKGKEHTDKNAISEQDVNRKLKAYGLRQNFFGTVKKRGLPGDTEDALERVDKLKSEGFTYDTKKGFVKDGKSYGFSFTAVRANQAIGVVGDWAKEKSKPVTDWVKKTSGEFTEAVKQKHKTKLSEKKAEFFGLKFGMFDGKEGYWKEYVDNSTGETKRRFIGNETEINKRMNSLGVKQNSLGIMTQRGSLVFTSSQARRKNTRAKTNADFFSYHQR